MTDSLNASNRNKLILKLHGKGTKTKSIVICISPYITILSIKKNKMQMVYSIDYILNGNKQRVKQMLWN